MPDQKTPDPAVEALAVELLERLERLVRGEPVRISVAEAALAHRSEAFARLRYRVFEELDRV